jgi:hypothetical protein
MTFKGLSFQTIPLNVLWARSFGMTITKIYVTPVITAIIIIIAVTATATTAVPNVAVLATPAPGQGGGNNATNATNATTGATTTTITPPPPAAGQQQQQQQQQQTIHIIKHGSNSYVISGSSSSVGSFDTTYRVAGERSAIRAAEHLIISTITDDFRKSPTIGYITPSSTTTTGTTAPEPTLPNPFATPEQITERITTEIRRVIGEAESNTSQGQYVEIKCNFGMSLEDMRCHYHPLLQATQ